MNGLENYDWWGALEKILLAVVILLVTWLVAWAIKAAMSRLIGNISFLQRSAGDGQNVGGAIGQILALLVWGFGLIAVLQVLGFETVLHPIQNMLNQFLGYLPNIIGAGVVFFIGFMLAKIARDLIRTALSSAGFDRGVARLMNRGEEALQKTPQQFPQSQAGFPGQPQPGQPNPAYQQAHGAQQAQPHGAQHQGARPVQQGQQGAKDNSPSNLVANLVYALILIVVTISALQILGITAISDPATAMLSTILNAIPAVLAAVALLALGWYVAKFTARLVESLLEGVGLDRVVHENNLLPQSSKASQIVGIVVQVAIVLLFAVMATEILNFPQITMFLQLILATAGRVIFGALFIAAGVAIASLIRNFLGEGSTAGQIIYWATVALFVAMGLNSMGIAQSIVNMAFGAVVIGAAAAAALAFGLGGRDVAARTLEKAERNLEQDSNTITR